MFHLWHTHMEPVRHGLYTWRTCGNEGKKVILHEERSNSCKAMPMIQTLWYKHFSLSGFWFCEWMPSYLCCLGCRSLNAALGKVVSPGCKRFWAHLQMSPIPLIFRAGGKTYQHGLAGPLLGDSVQYSLGLKTEQGCCDTETMSLCFPPQVTWGIAASFIRLNKCCRLQILISVQRYTQFVMVHLQTSMLCIKIRHYKVMLKIKHVFLFFNWRFGVHFDLALLLRQFQIKSTAIKCFEVIWLLKSTYSK